jgi:hypothetical protein
MRTSALIFLSATTFSVCSLSLAGEPFEALSAEVVRILREKFPEAELSKEKNDPDMLTFSRNAREFFVYRPLKTGEWQKPFNTPGPDKDGLLVRFYLKKGPWGGALEIPYDGTEDLYVFRETHVVRDSADGSCHIWAEILTPRFDPPADVAAKLVKLFNEFEKYLPAGK